MLRRDLSTWVKVEVKSHLAEEQEGQTGTRIKAGSEDNRRVVTPGDRV